VVAVTVIALLATAGAFRTRRPSSLGRALQIRGSVLGDGRALKTGSAVGAGCVIDVGQDGEAILGFPGRKSLLRSGSKARWIQQGEVEVESGETLFMVEPGTPFTVRTRLVNLVVRGTEFAVQVDPSTVTAFVRKGAVLAVPQGGAQVLIGAGGAYRFGAASAPERLDGTPRRGWLPITMPHVEIGP
jgi:hypothetical protein